MMEQGHDNPEPRQRSARGPIAGGAAAVALIALLFGLWSYDSGRNAGQGDAPASTTAEAAVAPGAAQTAAPQPGDTAAAPPEPAPVPAATAEPTFDMLRAGPDGTITVAGLAAPGATVEILLDGAVIDRVMAGRDGKFASVTLGQPSVSPRALTLRSFGTGGLVTVSAESLTVAPSPRALEQAAQAAGESPEAVADQTAQAEALAAKPLLADGDGVRVLAQGSGDLVIDTLAFDASHGVEISGRGAPEGAVLRAYIDNAEVGLVAANGEGAWRMVLPAPAPGPHQLRVDALDASGQVLARAETEFTAAPRDVLDAAARPGDGDTRPRLVTIEQGYTLWAIARETYGDPYLYVRVFEANRDQIRDPNRIYPGQVFTLPD
ncbi:LysM peptidoglycan-binding domain-containing protein [Paenirhodobacter populi]|nr:LysM peptidoglycan-binding domain-containing protein [Sinirhodobacter populi]